MESAEQFDSVKAGLLRYIEASIQTLPETRYLYLIIDQIEKDFILDHVEVISIEDAIETADRLLGRTTV